MQKQFLGLTCLALALAACSDSSTAPTPPVSGAPSALVVGPTKVMRLRGSLPAGGVSGQATGILYHGGPIIPQTKVAAIYWATNTIYTGGPAAASFPISPSAPVRVNNGAVDISYNRMSSTALRNLG